MVTDEDIRVNGSDCKNVKVEPVKVDVNTVTATDDFLKKFSDKPLTDNPDLAKNAKDMLHGFAKFINSDKFADKVNTCALKTGIPPRQIASGFISKTAGILGDVLGITVDVIHTTIQGILDLIYTVLSKGIEVIMSAARGLVRIVTFNKTAVTD